MRNSLGLVHWHFEVLNIAFIAMTALLLVRLLLMPIFGSDSPVMRVIRWTTAVVFAPVAAVTPRAVPRAVVILLAIAWLFVLRIALVFAAAAAGVRPALS